MAFAACFSLQKKRSKSWQKCSFCFSILHSILKNKWKQTAYPMNVIFLLNVTYSITYNIWLWLFEYIKIPKTTIINMKLLSSQTSNCGSSISLFNLFAFFSAVDNFIHSSFQKFSCMCHGVLPALSRCQIFNVYNILLNFDCYCSINNSTFFCFGLIFVLFCLGWEENMH